MVWVGVLGVVSVWVCVRVSVRVRVADSEPQLPWQSPPNNYS